MVAGTDQRRLILEGKLISRWAAELRSACEVARKDLPPGGLLVDMNVIAISQVVKNVLLKLLEAGANFRCRGVFTQNVVKHSFAA